ncbi:MAG: hypothetical protein ACK4UP_01380 [Spirosomataceae bacterium]
MKTLITGWTMVRVIRFIIGAIILVQSIVMNQYAIAAFGGIFMTQALLNLGCGSSNGCGVPTTRMTNLRRTPNTGDVEYEEVKGK